MQKFIDSYKSSKNLHHAYFFVGDVEEIFLKLRDFLETVVQIKTVGNPDFWYSKYNTLNIESAREISVAQERKDFSGERKVFVIQADFITEEAQNSLLKVFEEPTVGTHFFIIAPQDMLLPTLRSRMVTVLVESKQSEDLVSGKSILDLKPSERLKKVKEITDSIKDEDGTKQDAITLLNQIETELYKQGVEKRARELELCQITRTSLYDRGAPVKIILENLMLAI